MGGTGSSQCHVGIEETSVRVFVCLFVVAILVIMGSNREEGGSHGTQSGTRTHYRQSLKMIAMQPRDA